GIDNQAYGSFSYGDCLPRILGYGLKEEQLVPELQSRHTREQAELVIDMCRQRSWNRLNLVASNYHQHRAFLTFFKVLQERSLDRQVKIFNAAARLPWFEENPWGTRIQLLETEFEKIARYQAEGHVADFADAIAYYKWRSLE
ncbi:MAG TPA: ElyC/SanA/YdcF family protein, partial [Chitinophagaceae bacterium]